MACYYAFPHLVPEGFKEDKDVKEIMQMRLEKDDELKKAIADIKNKSAKHRV